MATAPHPHATDGCWSGFRTCQRVIMQFNHIIIAAWPRSVKWYFICWAAHNVIFWIVVFFELRIWVVVIRTHFRKAFLRIDERLQTKTIFWFLYDFWWYCVFERSGMFDFTFIWITLILINRPLFGWVLFCCVNIIRVVRARTWYLCYDLGIHELSLYG